MVYSAAERYGTVTINLIGTALIARLLSPDQIGIYLVGAAFVFLVEAIRDFGISGYLIQAQEVCSETLRSAFTATLVLAALSGLALFAASGPIASLYGDENLATVIRIAALGFVFAPVSGPLLGMLRRNLAFDRLMRVGIAAALSNLIVSASLALAGYGFQSLAWGAFASAAMTAAMAFHMRPDRFYGFGVKEIPSILRFGGYSTAATVVATLYQQLPQFVLGGTLGFHAVGLVNRALMICQLPEKTIISAVQPVFLPALSEHGRRGGDAGQAYLRGLTYITAVYWPALICLVLLATPLVWLLLGTAWLAVAPLVRIVGISWLFLFPTFLTYPVLVANGRVRDVLTIALLTLPPSAVLFVAASPWGLHAVAATTLITAPLQALVALSFILRRTGLGWADILGAVRQSALATAAAALPPAIATLAFGFDLPLVVALAAGTAAVAAWAASLVWTGHPLARELPPAAGRLIERLTDRFGRSGVRGLQTPARKS